MSGDNWVKGFCPLGCGPTLQRRETDDKIVCQHGRCPRPTAVSDLLADREHEHVVQFSDSGYTVKHPLRERLDDHLLRCLLQEFLGALSGPPVPHGLYRVIFNEHRQEYAYHFIGQPMTTDH